MNLFSLDHALFLLVNQLPHSPGLDGLALAISGIGNAGFIWIVFALYLFFREERRGWVFFAPFIAAALFASAASELFLKPMVARLRPAMFVVETIVVGADIPRSFSFPSTHATLAWALATVIAKEDPRLGRVSFVLAALVSLSRVYLGMHYPLDVMVGAVLGWAIGRVCVAVFLAPTHARRRRR
jgi:undecaprenyl-diphosphatase